MIATLIASVPDAAEALFWDFFWRCGLPVLAFGCVGSVLGATALWLARRDEEVGLTLGVLAIGASLGALLLWLHRFQGALMSLCLAGAVGSGLAALYFAWWRPWLASTFVVLALLCAVPVLPHFDRVLDMWVATACGPPALLGLTALWTRRARLGAAVVARASG